MGILFMKYLIKVKNFSKKYRVEEVIIEEILISKRITLIQGKNGCGKSTILKAIAGLVSYEGVIEVNGKVSYMSEFPSFPVDLSVKEFIGSLYKISTSKTSLEEVKNLYEIFKLDNKTDLLLSSLSKGMKAKVNLVQSLMEKADIYLLDEPISGLDNDGVKCLIKYLKNSMKSFVISTHLIDDFNKIHDEVIEL